MNIRTRLRVEHGGPRDLERGLFEGEELAPRAWEASVDPGEGTFVLDHGHVLADIEHLLLGLQVRVAQDEPDVEATLRLEGHPLGALGDRLARGGPAGRAVHRGTNAIGKQVHEVVDIFSSPATLAKFAQAVRRGGMSRRQKRTLLFLLLLTSLWLWLVGLAVLGLTGSSYADEWSVLFSLYFASLATNLFVPVPIEAVAFTASLSVGAAGAALACGAGKALGAWIIYTLGPTLRRGMARLEAQHLVVRRVLVGAQRFTVRFGYVALALMIAVPFSPLDIVPVYLFSIMGLRLKPFLAAIFVGFAARVYAVAVFGGALLNLLGIH